MGEGGGWRRWGGGSWGDSLGGEGATADPTPRRGLQRAARRGGGGSGGGSGGEQGGGVRGAGGGGGAAAGDDGGGEAEARGKGTSVVPPW
jgi:hypothetical protein